FRLATCASEHREPEAFVPHRRCGAALAVGLLAIVAGGAAFPLPAPPAAVPTPTADGEAGRWIHLLESPDREVWQRPDQVVQALQLRPGQRIADIGAGSGYFTRRFARAVGRRGKVWAVDIQPGMLR